MTRSYLVMAWNVRGDSRVGTVGGSSDKDVDEELCLLSKEKSIFLRVVMLLEKLQYRA